MEKGFDPRMHDKETHGCCSTMAMRPTAAQRLRDKARWLRDQAHNLEQLADQVGVLSEAADAALYDLACQVR